MQSMNSEYGSPYLVCQYVKSTKQILTSVCVVEFSGLHSNSLVRKLVIYCKCVYSFPVFYTKLFWQPQLPKLFCKNYRIVVLTVYVNGAHFTDESSLSKYQCKF